jgi:hypothetical protein
MVNHTRLLAGSLLVVVVLAVLIGAVVVAQVTTPNSFAASSDVVRQPRPHPISHLSGAVKPIGVDGIARQPRPHPISHIERLVDRP